MKDYTLLCEVESIINGRPLTTNTDHPNDLEPLTPNHLLALKTQPSFPPGVFTKDDVYARRRWETNTIYGGSVLAKVDSRIPTASARTTKMARLKEKFQGWRCCPRRRFVPAKKLLYVRQNYEGDARLQRHCQKC